MLISLLIAEINKSVRRVEERTRLMLLARENYWREITNNRLDARLTSEVKRDREDC